MTSLWTSGSFVRLAAGCVAILVSALPVSAATVDSTWSFDTNAEGFTATLGAHSSAAYDPGEGNPAGALFTQITGRNRNNDNYWEWTGTFEDMGVPAGATVSAIQLTGGFTRCTIFTNGNTSTAGPWELRNAVGDVILATLYTGRTFAATDGAWVPATGASQTLADLASNTTVRLRLNNNLVTINNATTQVRLYDDQVTVQITYTLTANTPPTVTITAPPDTSSFTEGANVTFAGTANDTEDGDISANLSWTSSIDGSIGTGASFSRSDLSVGTHTITASVTDSGGLQDQDQITITINANTAPTVTITAPPDASGYNQGDTVNFSGTAGDVEDGDLTASLSWTSSIDGSIGSGGSFSRSDLSPGSHTITASVTDGGGLSGQDQITITVNGPPAVIISAPPNSSNHNQGADITFTGTASDVEDGDLTASLAWTSSIDGPIGTGGSFSRNDLSLGAHTITASVTDSGGLSDQDPITITVNAVTNEVTPGAASANIDTCNQITVTAPFTGDDNGDSTTLFERSPNGVDSWAAVSGCGAVSGASPRVCIDANVADNSVNYYRVSFTDPDNTPQPTPEVIGPYDTTPFCGEDATTIGNSSAEAASCTQIIAIARFTGDANQDGTTRVEYKLTTDGTWSTGCDATTGASPRQCTIPELTASASYDIRITFTDLDGVTPDGDATPNSETIVPADSPVALPACGADVVAPTLWILSPTHNAILGGTDRVLVQVYEANLSALEWSADSDNDLDLIAAGLDANFTASLCGGDPACSVYTFNLDTVALGQGSHYFTIRATDTESNVTRLTRAFQVNNTGSEAAGDGRLLRRTPGSQICIDCHNLETHSSATTSDKYGNWSIDCETCHTPHRTTNIALIRQQVRTPNSGVRDVRFETQDGAVADSSVAGSASFVNEDNAAQSDGPCQACHTRTSDTSGTTARWRNADGGGNADTHYTSSGTSSCTGCHTHDAGFSGAGGACDSCHFAPPTVGKHGNHDEVGTLPSSWANLTPSTTATQYGYACAKCHGGSGADHFPGESAPYDVDVVFDETQDPRNPTGAYTPDAPSQATDPGVNGDGWNWSDGTCSNMYCHSNAGPVGAGAAGSSATVTWDQDTVASPVTCVSCHDTRGRTDSADPADLSTAHGKHIQSTSGEGSTYSFTCDECHAQTIRDDPNNPWVLDGVDLSDKRNHADGVRDVFFSSTATAGSIDQSAGAYDGTPNFTCSGTYCHSQGTSTVTFAAPNDPNLAWDAGTANCRSCHSGDATTTPTMSTGRHAAHVNNLTSGGGVLGENYECATCHSGTVTAGNNETITGYANHVDGEKDVAGALVDSPYTATDCSSSYCHSSGQAPPGAGTSFEYYTVDWAAGSPLDCGGCHGQHSENAFPSQFGEPNYTNDGAGIPDANSHQRHVAAATDCANCHNDTTTTGTSITAGATNHTDQTRDVVIAPAFDTGDPNYTVGTKTCQNVACHGTGTPQWGGTLVCLDCHDGPDDSTLGDGTPNGVGNEWNNAGATGPGHGTPGYGDFASTGGANPSAMGGCDYCHDLGASHTPTSATNPYRVRFSTTDNTLCLQCHSSGDNGIGQNSEGTTLNTIDSSLDVDTAHFGTRHQDGEGGQFCWDCHDPHGAPSNILMVKSSVSITTQQSGGNYYGVPATTGTVGFTARADYTDFVQTSGGTPRTGLCQACHDPNKGADTTTGSTKYWRWDGNDNDGQPSDHNATPGKPCIDCHFHTDNFKGAGGDCLSCHGDASGAPGRRAVNTDFGKPSHHVGTGGTYMGGALTNLDCVVCHAEGTAVEISPGVWQTDTDGQPHQDGVINLRDSDSATAYFNYDKDAVETAAGGPGSPTNWNSGLQEWREWTSGVDEGGGATLPANAGLDPFCLSCHDSGGAAQTYSREAGGGALNPFADGAITNEYDRVVRSSDGTGIGRVVDIASRVVAGGSSLDQAGEPRYDESPTGDSIPDPPEGIYSRHAIRGQSLSVYSGTHANWDNDATYWTNTTLWNSTSVMGCADCHTVDGANTTSGNAHGSDSEYLLKDGGGLAREGDQDPEAGEASYNCFLCHTAAHYDDSSSTHTGNTSDYTDYTDEVGSARIPVSNSGGNIYAMACTNCHGGGLESASDPGTGWEFGTIHGTSQTMDVYGPVGMDPGTIGTRKAYRFMNGNSMRFYQPDSDDASPWNWSGSDVKCYTLGAGDSFGGCTKHDGGQDFTKPVVRDLKY